MKATNSYKKYYDIMKFIDDFINERHRLTGIRENQAVSVIDISNHIGLSRKQTIRCVAEIAEVNEQYRLTKIGRTTAIVKEIKDV